MKYLFLFVIGQCFIASLVGAQKIEVLKGAKSLDEVGYADLEHPHKGCPENSECNVEMGLDRQRWLKFLEDYKKLSSDSLKNKALANFSTQFGWPLSFYFFAKVSDFKPILFSSPCLEHNPKNKPEAKVLVATHFVKSLSPNLIFSQNKTDLSFEIGKDHFFAPAWVYGINKTLYSIPINEAPLYFENDQMVLLINDEDEFFELLLSSNGNLKLRTFDFKKPKVETEEITCPEKLLEMPTPFSVSYCLEIPDIQLKKKKIVRLFRGCVNS
jgi:hypothetical protein